MEAPQLSDEDVKGLWQELILQIRPELRQATEAWEALGDKYRSLPPLKGT